ncbi:hypothetical protein MIR68_006914 [Amoeboaphelidium protococcarum]|nr:hypothetical protein MIR68_006914 [Amoeboaphelidium protococcarum]
MVEDQFDKNYPDVVKMARDFLAVPSSSVASEQQFSQTGLKVSEKRHSLEPKTIEAMIGLTNQIPGSEGRGTDVLVVYLSLIDNKVDTTRIYATMKRFIWIVSILVKGGKGKSDYEGDKKRRLDQTCTNDAIKAVQVLTRKSWAYQNSYLYCQSVPPPQVETLR